MRTCSYQTASGPCAAPARAYLPGPRCIWHTPAALAGRPEATPDPARTVAGLRAATEAAREAAA